MIMPCTSTRVHSTLLFLLLGGLGCAAASASTASAAASTSAWPNLNPAAISALSDPEISYVLEPFENLGEASWFSDLVKVEVDVDVDNGNDVTNGNDKDKDKDNDGMNLKIDLNVTSKDNLFGKSALRVDYSAASTSSSASTSASSPAALEMTFGWLQQEEPHNCFGAKWVSIWYKVAETPASTCSAASEGEGLGEGAGAGATQGLLKLTLLDDSHCGHSTPQGFCQYDDIQEAGKNLQHYSQVFTVSLDTSTDWTELRVPVKDLDLQLTSKGGLGQDLNLKRLRGWKLELAVAGDFFQQDTVQLALDQDSHLVMLFDQLACIGGGDLLGAPLHQDKNIPWDVAVNESMWIQEFYQSEISEQNTHVEMNDGVVSFNWTTQMVENWGGYMGFTYVAPGSAYYNLTGATDWHLSYHCKRAQVKKRRTHFRIIMTEGSSCVAEDCGQDYWGHERWYSFHYVLDDNVTNDGYGEMYVPLVADTEPGQPFWLTGWTGALGDRRMDPAIVKGVTLEFNVDSLGEMYDVFSGAIDVFNMSAVNVVYNETFGASNDGTCVMEPSLYLDETSPALKRVEFHGNQCCQLCYEDETCLYALSTARDCFVASYLDAETVGIAKADTLLSHFTVFWMDDAHRRGDFCDRCDCRQADQTIDCRGRNLTIIPKTFNNQDWAPKTLDLTDNPNIVVLGQGALSSLRDSLQELWLPKEMRHISLEGINDMSTLSAVHFEQGTDQQALDLSNVIADPSGLYDDICCTPGQEVSLTTPTAGLTFCEMEAPRLGMDATYLPFIEFWEATPYRKLQPGSEFMAEASESLEKCAEYCTTSSACNYFSYDDRLPNANPICYLLVNNGTGGEPHTICCEADHYADENQTIPGWVSGLPPRTRHDVDNAKVILDERNLVVTPSNNYETEYHVRLGSSPLRGAVWIEPKLDSSTYLEATFLPPRVVLYDANSTATVVVQVSNVDARAKSVSLVVNNIVSSCDAAFTEGLSDGLRETTVFIDVEIPDDESGSNLGIVIAVSVAVIIVIALGIYWYIEHKRRLSDAVWKVKADELEFDEPPEILGRGTFGLVLKATYRGTGVAVKRVIPPKSSKGKASRGPRDSMNSSMNGAGTRSTSGTGSVNGSVDMLSSVNNGTASTMMKSGSESTHLFFNKKKKSSGDQDYAKLKSDFLKEMRHLSKLRHPCITTVMGAVISKNSEPMLVMEYMEHRSLYDLLQHPSMIIEGELLLPILRDISQGVRFLHAANPQVIHGDLKAANILVDQRFHAKVADFGLSQKKAMGACGTPYWMAPELLRGESTNTTASDVYAFGVILAEVYSRKDPYLGENPSEVLKMVADKKIQKRPEVPADMPPQVKALLNDCLADDPSQRPSFDELDQRLKRADAKTVEPSQTRKVAQNAMNISLYDIFPAHIAKALEEGKQVEAEHKDCVTIFFSDIVGFTTISSTLPPRKIADMLDRLYHALDDLSHKHDLYKVETIGDAYMAVTNLVKDQPNDHAKRIAEFAVEAIAAANQTAIDTDDLTKGYVNIRVGFHSGPIVADVVGNRNPRYCLFGDSVNVASRMESNSKPGRIHCSKSAADLLKKQCPGMRLTSRGNIEIKGKGDMHTYWVVGGASGDYEEVPAEEAPLGADGIDKRKFEVIEEEKSGQMSIFDAEDSSDDMSLFNDEPKAGSQPSLLELDDVSRKIWVDAGYDPDQFVEV
ncbi:activated protein kinase catalytic subunit alpha-1 [Seminavis robusta]|uniref:Guanylate cyclase n=1 Tax=Seminavis robusta TaxID=568900 RepID=A0A9N8DE50_9STRA|nr:activated protein kinase catalytic subunit alpha-1 [Seminavis robusta]|eukprot:Sro53_g031250.1 activated protein kinase catalytic subunit alpha-1 (1692) ;mRNA; r:6740-12677